ncbi:MAG: hypothetical protein V4670_01240 [Bacteroidota bacterium]
MNSRNKPTIRQKKTAVKKNEVSSSKTKSVTSKQGLKKKLNEFGDEDSL